ncbi:MAG: helix-turn-helix domain-containing protein [Planctomycetes bacterium]|nr:helix-turn-helix domain-containing protein [Planctomycetota bacterium]
MNSKTPTAKPDIDPTTPLLLTAEAAAQALSVPEATVRNLHRTGQLRGIIIGKHLRFSPVALRSFVEHLDEEAESTDAAWTRAAATGS